jgi:hypothetical protein
MLGTGKLQVMEKLLRDLKAGNHRVLIFTQMTRMLDVLEAFLNHQGHIYLRLDGATKVDQRQVLTKLDRFTFCQLFCVSQQVRFIEFKEGLIHGPDNVVNCTRLFYTYTLLCMVTVMCHSKL